MVTDSQKSLLSQTQLSYRSQYSTDSDLENLTSDQLKTQIEKLKTELKERINPLEMELENRKSLIRLTDNKLKIIEEFKKYFSNRCNFLIYDEKGFFNNKLIFYFCEIKMTKNNDLLNILTLLEFKNVSKEICTILDLTEKYDSSDGYYYIKLNKKITRGYIYDKLEEILNIKFGSCSLTSIIRS